MNYAPEILDEDYDDGTMVANLEELTDSVVGHRIISAETTTVPGNKTQFGNSDGLVLTLDNGTQVGLVDTSDCCAYTELTSFLLHPELVDHIITGVGTTEEYTRWHIYADMGDVLELQVEWSCGNPFYYGYGFEIYVTPIDES